MPRTRIQTSGICAFCKGEFDKSKMTTHLKHCKQRKTALVQDEQAHAGLQVLRKSRILHILVEGRYLPEYWLHLEVPAWVWLYDLDNFLRAIWLECCGHLSEFKIDNVHYTSMSDEYYIFSNLEGGNGESGTEAEDEDEEADEEIDDSDDYEEIPKPSPEEEEVAILAQVRETLASIVTPDMSPDKVAMLENMLQVSYKANASRSSIFNMEEYSMDVKVGKIFKTGVKASYTYDFGSSTDLNVRVLAEREADVYELDEDEQDEVEDEDENGNEGEEDVEDEDDTYEYHGITIIARNIPPVIACDSCGKPAAWISTINGYKAMCDACSKKSHVDASEENEDEEYEDDRYFEEGLLPVVNSPRVGVCAYTG